MPRAADAAYSSRRRYRLWPPVSDTITSRRFEGRLSCRRHTADIFPIIDIYDK